MLTYCVRSGSKSRRVHGRLDAPMTGATEEAESSGLPSDETALLSRLESSCREKILAKEALVAFSWGVVGSHTHFRMFACNGNHSYHFNWRRSIIFILCC